MSLVLPHGRSALAWEDPHSPGRPITLECYRPASHRPGSPVVLVQHGMGRNGDEYRDAWIPAADDHGLLIVAPTFSDEAWPLARLYNDGHVREEDGTVRPRAAWSNRVPALLFAQLRAEGITTRPRAHLWGHSAGGQFVHRVASLHDTSRLEALGAANAGWYTWPSLDQPYPQGLGGLDLDDAALLRLLACPMTIFAGDQDNQTDAPNLPKHEAALAQGPHRHARAHAYYAAGRAEAARRNAPFGWALLDVPGIGHEGFRMADVSARWWFEGKRPAAPTTFRAITAEA